MGIIYRELVTSNADMKGKKSMGIGKGNSSKSSAARSLEHWLFSVSTNTFSVWPYDTGQILSLQSIYPLL